MNFTLYFSLKRGGGKALIRVEVPIRTNTVLILIANVAGVHISEIT